MKGFTAKEAGKLLSRYAPSHRACLARNHFQCPSLPRQHIRRHFHNTPALNVVKPYLLADIGEGITECQVIQWFVQPGARVEQFDPICEVQSDKASVEITSRFDGVIKKLYYEPDDMAKVGKPLVDIDIQSDITPEDEALLNGSSGNKEGEASPGKPLKEKAPSASPGVESNDAKAAAGAVPPPTPSQSPSKELAVDETQPSRERGSHATLATPAVRHMIKQLNLNIEDIDGTGRDGRVTKDDIQKFVETRKTMPEPTSAAPEVAISAMASTPVVEDQVRPLTPVQAGMFKQMTRSLSIPHFLYTDAVDFSALSSLRKKFNAGKGKGERLTPLPFIIKAVSLALQQFPLLNAHLDTSGDKPKILVKGRHHIGIAIDSPSGLLVPVVRDVQSHSVQSLAAEIARLSDLARKGKLSTADISGATFTVSNIGSIGGTAVSPVIVTPQVGILGIGRARVVPAFGEHGELVKKEECVFSWSADHRIIDGAMAARCAETVRGYVENIETLLIRLR